MMRESTGKLSGTNYKDRSESEATAPDETYMADIEAPSLIIDKKNLSFYAQVGKVAFDTVKIINNGSASIYYQWKRVNPSKSFEFQGEDLRDYFHLHYVTSYNSQNIQTKLRPAMSSSLARPTTSHLVFSPTSQANSTHTTNS
jgi:hypothetical protein